MRPSAGRQRDGGTSEKDATARRTKRSAECTAKAGPEALDAMVQGPSRVWLDADGQFLAARMRGEPLPAAAYSSIESFLSANDTTFVPR